MVKGCEARTPWLKEKAPSSEVREPQPTGTAESWETQQPQREAQTG